MITIKIRKATKSDSTRIAELMMLAMGDIVYSFIGEKSEPKAITFLDDMIQQDGNQYSFHNCWVAEDNQQVVGIAIVYDGAKLSELRTPVLHHIKNKYNQEITLQDETQAGEFYIDCIAVSPNCQGQGIGAKLLHFLKVEYVTKHKQPLGLLVDKENTGAKKLYMRNGFKYQKDVMFTHKEMEHLQLKP